MKKIKIMLTAVIVMAVVGGALAFRAKNFNAICYYSSTTNQDQDGLPKACPFVGKGFSTTNVIGAPQTYATTRGLVNGVCPNGPFQCDLTSTRAADL